MKGYNHHLLFTTTIVTPEKFKYFELFKEKEQLVSLHTVAILCLNHIATNQLPVYLNILPTTEQKVIKTFLKFTQNELQIILLNNVSLL